MKPLRLYSNLRKHAFLEKVVLYNLCLPLTVKGNTGQTETRDGRYNQTKNMRE